jgi:hypothetical protein
MVGDKIGAAAIAAVDAASPRDQARAVLTGVTADKTGSHGKIENGKTGKTRTCNIRCSAVIVLLRLDLGKAADFSAAFRFLRDGFAVPRLLDSMASLC